MLSSFHLNGHTLRFHPQTAKLEPHLIIQTYTHTFESERFHARNVTCKWLKEQQANRGIL